MQYIDKLIYLFEGGLALCEQEDGKVVKISKTVVETLLKELYEIKRAGGKIVF